MKKQLRLHETIIFEGPGSEKDSENWPKVFPNLFKNQTYISIDFLVHFTSKNQSKIDQKSTKINKKSTKNPPKIEVWKALGQIWSCLGPTWPIQGVGTAILDRLGGILEVSWAVQGVLRAILDRFGTVLEASWAVLGRERWPTWDQLGVQNGAKID